MAAGLSRRQAAVRLGVAVSSTSKWGGCYQATSSAAPGKMGGNTPKMIAGGHTDWLRQRCRERAFTLRGLVHEPASGRALKVEFCSVWAFVHAETQSYEKSRRSPVTPITATSPGGGHNGLRIGTASIRPAWCSSTVCRDRRAGGTA